MDAPRADMRKLNLTRWVIYLLVGAVVVLFCALPLEQEFEASKDVKAVFNRVDALEPGAHVLLAFDYDPASEAELKPMSRVLLLHCFQKKLIPIVMTHWSNGLTMDKGIIDNATAEAAKEFGRPFQSGRDYVFLGFRPAGSNLILNMGENLKSAFDKDFYGQPTRAMPALQGVNSLKDIDLAVDFAAGATPQMWIAYGSDRFGFPLGVGTTAVQAPDMIPFVQSNQLVGYLGGLRGAADYEALLAQSYPKAKAYATRGMVAQSATHVLLILLIVGANIRLIVGRLNRKQKGRSHG